MFIRYMICAKKREKNHPDNATTAWLPFYADCDLSRTRSFFRNYATFLSLFLSVLSPFQCVFFFVSTQANFKMRQTSDECIKVFYSQCFAVHFISFLFLCNLFCLFFFFISLGLYVSCVTCVCTRTKDDDIASGRFVSIIRE